MKHAALLLASCASAAPDYLELSPSYGQGSSTFERPVTNFDSETWALGVTVGWNLGVQHQAYRNLAALDVSKAGQLRTTDEKPPAALSLSFDQREAQEPEEKPKGVEALLEKPRSTQELLINVAWLTAVVLLVGLAVKWGVWEKIMGRGSKGDGDA